MKYYFVISDTTRGKGHFDSLTVVSPGSEILEDANIRKLRYERTQHFLN